MRGIFVGVDWAEAHNDVLVMDEGGVVLGRGRFGVGVSGLAGLHGLVADHVEDPAGVVVGIEIDHGLLVDSLVGAGYCVYATNPLAASRYRDTRAGMEVLTATNGADALELIRAEGPDVCVLDVGMPRIGGFDLTRMVRCDERTAAIPVVLLTAAARVTDEAEGLAAGADAYPTKPFSPTALVARVRELLAQPV